MGTMLGAGVDRIYTFNDADSRPYPLIKVIVPQP